MSETWQLENGVTITRLAYKGKIRFVLYGGEKNLTVTDLIEVATLCLNAVNSNKGEVAEG